jgi:hypothetical protein
MARLPVSGASTIALSTPGSAFASILKERHEFESTSCHIAIGELRCALQQNRPMPHAGSISRAVNMRPPRRPTSLQQRIRLVSSLGSGGTAG